MADEKLAKFGMVFVAEARDAVIEKVEAMVQGQYKSSRSQELHRWAKEKFAQIDARDLRKLIVAIVDQANHATLVMLNDSSEYHVTHTSSQAQPVDVSMQSDGLEGELYGEEGWVRKLSKWPFAFPPE